MPPIHRLARQPSLYKLFLETSVLAEVNIVMSFIHCFHPVPRFGAFTDSPQARLDMTRGGDPIWGGPLLFPR